MPVLAFGPAAALTVLATLGGPGQPDDPATASGSLAYLAAVARFASGLAERGRVLPVLAAEDGTLAARWRPVLGGADVQRARDLAAAMPPACRALGVETPGPLLGDALDALTDAAARARLPSSLLPGRRGRVPARLPVAERYALALTAPDARVEVLTAKDEDEAATLAAELGAWLDGARIPAGPVRTCFRLAEPEAVEGDPWRVEFALQSADDPSLMVSAADVWAGLGAGMAPGGDPVEELLAGLAPPPGSSPRWRAPCGRRPRPWWSWTRPGLSGSSRRPGRCWPEPGSACCCPTAAGAGHVPSHGVPSRRARGAGPRLSYWP